MFKWLWWKLGQGVYVVRTLRTGERTIERVWVDNATQRLFITPNCVDQRYYLKPDGTFEDIREMFSSRPTKVTCQWSPYTGIGSATRTYWPIATATSADVEDLFFRHRCRTDIQQLIDRLKTGNRLSLDTEMD